MKRFKKIVELTLIAFFGILIGGFAGGYLKSKKDNAKLIIKVYDYGEVLNIVSKNRDITIPKSEVSQVYYLPNNTVGAYIDLTDVDFSDHVIELN